MSDERIKALSLAIAREMEPEPMWKDWLSDETAWQFYIRSTQCVSDGGFWEVYRDPATEDDATKHAIPITNPAVAIRLLKELIVVDYGIDDLEDGHESFGFRPEMLELTIAEAFVRARNLEVK